MSERKSANSEQNLVANPAFQAANELQAKIAPPTREAVLAAAANNAPICYFLLGPQKKIMLFGGAAVSEFGASTAIDVGVPVEQVFQGAPNVLAAVERAYSGESAEEMAVVCGARRTMRVFPMSEGAVSGYVAIVAHSSDHVANGVAKFVPENLVDCLSEGVITANPEGEILFASNQARAMLGTENSELIGSAIGSVFPEISTELSHLPISKEISLPRENGFSRSLAVSLKLSEVEGKSIITTILTDNSELDAARLALTKSNARYALVAAGANDGLWEWNFQDGTIQFSARWRTLLGLEAATIKHTPDEWLCRIHPQDVDGFCDRFDSHLEGHTSLFEHEYRMKHANGEYRWVQARGLVARRDDGEPFLMAGSQSDITDRKMAEESLTHGALHDALTGLPNRALVLDRVNQALARLAREELQSFALAILDLDRFMLVNESLGHAAGDELLVSLARRLENRMIPGNTLARLGGDEFAILFEAFESVDQIRDVISDLQEVISQSFNMNGKEIFVSASIGVAIGAPGYMRAEEVLRDADLAMYRAKKEGKAGFEIFDETRHRRSVDLLQIETDLRRALDNGDIIAHYQPIVDLKDGTVTGFEALVRMSHPVRGVVPPGEFIGIAEDTGLIVPLGERVLEMACATARDWQTKFGLKNKLSMSVNFSARHLAQENIVSRLESILEQSSLPPEDLKIEITESLIMANPELAAQTFARIKELGVTLSLDDFGTGYSSLSYLRRFPIDTLKMDRSFVGRMDTDERDMELVRMIIMLAHTLGMEVIGEGVETESQLAILRELNCEFGQGYYFARPLTEEDAVAFLSAPPHWK